MGIPAAAVVGASRSIPEHPVAGKLRQSIVPYLVSARRLSRQPVLIAHTIHRYGSDVMAALIGVGFSSPLLSLLAADGIKATAPMIGNLPIASATVVVLWLGVKVVVSLEDGEKRAALGKSCVRELRRQQAVLYRAVALAEPMEELTKIQTEIHAIVDRNIQEGAWPWPGPAPGIDEEVSTQVERIRRDFSSNWTAAPPGDSKR